MHLTIRAAISKQLLVNVFLGPSSISGNIAVHTCHSFPQYNVARHDTRR